MLYVNCEDLEGRVKRTMVQISCEDSLGGHLQRTSGCGGCPACQFHVVLPVICCEPSYRGPVLQSIVNHKSRSPPDSAGSCSTTLVHDSPAESEKCCTPYRLPRISPRTTPPPGDEGPTPSLPPHLPSASLDASESERVWGRFGYEDIVRMPELGPSVHKAHMNMSPVPSGTTASSSAGARSIAKGRRHRIGTMMVPQFHSAAITPAVSVHISLRRADDASVTVYQSLMDKAAKVDHHPPANPAPTPTAISRSVSPAKSAQSIHWTLGSSHRHLLFDRKGQGRKQGPYSREFTVRCMAPSNWMRMKWGRQKTMVH